MTKEPPAQASGQEPSLYQMLAEGASDVLVLLGPDLRRLYVSPSCWEVMGYSAEELLGGRADALVHDGDLERVTAVLTGLCEAAPIAQVAWRMRRRDGSYRWMETRFRRLRTGNVVTGIRDIQDRKDIESQLEAALDRVERLAMEDQLTGLPNRRCFIDAIERRLTLAGSGGRAALFILDLNDFKVINDRFGHTAGDMVLAEVGRRLQTAMPSHLVARLGGDEFAMLVDGADARVAETIAAEAVRAVTVPIQCGYRSVEVGISIGIALCPEHETDPRVLLSHADAAMYRVKHAGGRSGFCLFDPAIDDQGLRAADDPRGLPAGEIVP